MVKHYLFASLFAAALFSACSNDYEGHADVAGVKLDLNGIINDNVQTRVDAEGDGNKWANGDAIGVYTENNGNNDASNVKYTNSADAAEKGTFSSDKAIYLVVADTVKVIAYYPYIADDDANWDSSSKYKFNIASGTDNAYKAYDFMHVINGSVVRNSDASTQEVSLAFSHKMNRVKLSLNGVTIKETDNVTYTLEGIKTEGTFNTKTGEIELGSDKGTVMFTSNGSNTAYLIYPPQTSTKLPLTIKVSNSDGDKYYSTTLPSLKTGDEDKTTTDGTTLNYDVTLSGNEATVTLTGITINGWSTYDGGTLEAKAQDESTTIDVTATDWTGGTASLATGDQIGLFAVYDGAVVDKCNNVPLTKTADGWTGLDTSVKYENGTVFYAYYPYTSGLTGFSATKGFETIISKWNPAKAASYSAGDLMTSAGTQMVKEAGKPQTTLSLALTHAMSMVEITASSAGDVIYNFTNDGMDSYKVSASGSSSSPTIKLGSTTISNYAEVNGKYRVLVNPSTSSTLSVTYDGKNYSPSSKFVAGECITMSVGSGSGATEKTWTLEVGDIMLSDGNLAKASSITSAEKAKAIGIVYYVGNPSPIYLYSSSYSASYSNCNALPSSCVHGLVISTSTMSISGNAWGTEAWESGDFLAYYNDRATYGVLAECSSTNVTKRILGYDNLAVFKLLGAKYSTLVSALAAKSSPSTTSGWYVPSYPEISLIYSGALSKAASKSSDSGYSLSCSADAMDAALTAVGASSLWTEGTIYMTSTLEFNSKKAGTGKVYGFDGSAFGKYTLSTDGLEYVIRPALAF